MSEVAYSYCVVREDLTWPQRVVQAGHAWWEAAQLHLSKVMPAPHFVLLGVANEDALLDLRKKLKDHKIEYSAFYEEDYDLGYTAIATVPLVGDQRELFAGMNVLRLETSSG